VSRPYESVLIFDSSMDESQIEEKVERFKRILSGDRQNAVQSVPWGKRKLAYPIGKREQGIYVILRFETDPAALQEFERVARLDEQILRHLTIVNPPESALVGAGAGAASPRESRAAREEE
jgi:small subunit ribosomal protein S6